MNIRFTLAILILATLSIGARAQTQKSFQRNSNNPRSERKEKILKQKGLPVKHTESSFRTVSKISNLKADPVPTLNKEQKLDSLFSLSWDYDSMRLAPRGWEFYYYDATGRNYSTWDSDWQGQAKGFVPDNKYDIEWDGNNRITKETRYHWIDTSEIWVPQGRMQFQYDNMGNMIVQLDLEFDRSGKFWYPYDLDSTYYATDGRILKEIEYIYDTVTKQWGPSYLQEYIYYPNKTLDMKKTYYWLSDTVNDWEENNQVWHYYDENLNDTMRVTWYWDGSQWTEEYREKTYYNARGLPILEEDWYWDGGYMDWFGSWKVEYTYDGNDKLTERLEYYYEFFEGYWYLEIKDEYTWDAFGNQTYEMEYQYDTLNKEWILRGREIWTYDLSREIKDIAMPFWWTIEFFMDGELPFNNKVTSYTEFAWDTAKMAYDTTHRDIIYYSDMGDVPVNESSCQAAFDWELETMDDLVAIFTDKSDTSIVSWYWMFGDGESSTRQNPVHKYKSPGTYKVVLTTVDISGYCSNTRVEQVKVGTSSCAAAFSYLIDTVKQEVTLTNNSTGSNLKYFWNFGDGSMSKDQNPVHTYEFPGSYKIVLTVMNETGTCMDKFSADVQAGEMDCNADFVAYIDSSFNTVLLRPISKDPNLQYMWILGDGTVARTRRYNHRFSHPGFYSARLTVWNDEAGCVDTKKEVILVGKNNVAGLADFMFAAGEGNSVKFTDRSIGTDLAYHWDFNDSKTSKEQNPVHSYAVSGYYNVCLTVTDKTGNSNTKCQRIFAGSDTRGHCLARFSYKLSNLGRTINLYDRSFGNPDKWFWRSNKMHSSVEQNPEWSIALPGYVRVHQGIRNTQTGCKDHAFALVNMGAKSKFLAMFGYVVDSTDKKADTYPVDFVGTSLGDGGKLKWDFGDGTVDSTSINPTHIYAQPGEYNVCLTITNTSTGEVAEYCEKVIVGAGPSGTYQPVAGDGGIIAYPNPFGETATIKINLANSSGIELSLYDLMGRKVRTMAKEFRNAGTHTFELLADDQESGNYYLILDTKNGRSRKIISIIK